MEPWFLSLCIRGDGHCVTSFPFDRVLCKSPMRLIPVVLFIKIVSKIITTVLPDVMLFFRPHVSATFVSYSSSINSTMSHIDHLFSVQSFPVNRTFRNLLSVIKKFARIKTRVRLVRTPPW